MLTRVLHGLAPAVLERLTLLLNHLLTSEPAARQRLVAHAGQTMVLVVEGSPAFLPSPPPAAWRITPAGLLESAEVATSEAGLRITIEAADPLRLLAQWAGGHQAGVTVQGDAALAATVAWLMEHLRWDLEADLARAFGDAPGRQLAELLRGLGAGLRRALQALAGWAPGAARPSV